MTHGAPPRPPKDVTDAVRETVQVRGQDQQRHRIGRSQSSIPPQTTSRPSPASHRSHSQDSVARTANAMEKSKTTRHRPKKGSQHADVIDRLDFTGVGPMFHHDGPFDACAPSRNRQRNKAPMMAWSGSGAAPEGYVAPGSPYAEPYVPEPPKKKVDAIAEAWGIHEPEPFEEFFAGGDSGNTPASSIYNGRAAALPKHIRDRRDGHLDDGASPRRSGQRTRGTIPPPQPIFVPDSSAVEQSYPVDYTPPAVSPNSAPKRSKSLMQRIRKMRETPNVPVNNDYEGVDPPASPNETRQRPTHRTQNSYMGGGATPRRDRRVEEPSEPFVFIENSAPAHKDLPATPGSKDTPESPPDAAQTGYFDGYSSPGGGGLGRKTSLMKKVGRVVRGRDR
ncbi:Pal1 cell morphology protein-domain-containing protein [Schizophyllum amplum]|uniref:Pal1 cell morphology protein-domain-containing protein n=1 Tax=Schizophyllum amplum TaxID=97359 RepID=A0A550C602_9AGAR|nr:Pal1 cell morphology protein-domain-containing protein [Auriculariopsis ampla]